MGKLDGRVVFITGAARGQGRAHAVKCAQEGADIIALDNCEQIDSVEYPMATTADLDLTAELVSDLGRQIMTKTVDTRDRDALAAAVGEAINRFGRIDGVLANAGILNITGEAARRFSAWQDAIDVNLTGTFNTIDACVPALIEAGRGGSIVLTSSIAGIKAVVRDVSASSAGYIGYTASKHGIIGIMKAYALLLGSHNIRVNAVLPTGVNSPMCVNDQVLPFLEQHSDVLTMQNVLPVELVEVEDVANTVAWLVSDDARYITGVALPVDAGCAIR
jgi:SDR family mycofactocin-dependent oxidoreductase